MPQFARRCLRKDGNSCLLGPGVLAFCTPLQGGQVAEPRRVRTVPATVCPSHTATGPKGLPPTGLPSLPSFEVRSDPHLPQKVGSGMWHAALS